MVQTTSDTAGRNVQAIECPSCRQTVMPTNGSACPECEEDLSILLALRKVIDRLSSGAHDFDDAVSE